MADEPETETVETVETVTETETETVVPVADDEEPPAWFKKHLAAEESKKTKTVAPKPTKTAAPAKKAAPVASPSASPASTESEPKRKRSGASRVWFGSRADE